MIRIIITTFLLCMATSYLSAGYIEERQKANDLARKRKNDQALVAYVKLSEGNFTDFQKSDALEQAVSHALELKKYDLAKELTGKIPMEQVKLTCLMRIMHHQRRWKELIDQFAKEDINGWPESLWGNAYALRGNAYHQLKKDKKAIKELEKAVHYQTDPLKKVYTLRSLGEAYTDLGNISKAVKAYQKIHQTDKVDLNLKIYAAITTAKLLSKQGEFEKALKEIDRYPVNTLQDFWRFQMLIARADILATDGQKEKAIAKYSEILQTNGINSSQKILCEKAIEKLNANQIEKKQ